MRVIAVILASAVAAAAPAATTGPAEGISTSSATVTGTVDPNGAATTYHFEYGTSSAYGLSTGARDVGAGTEPIPVRESLSGLSPNSDYHYRVLAENSSGVVKGVDATFHTAIPVGPPRAVTQVPRAVGATGSILRGTVVPDGAQTEYHFEYGTTVEYGQATLSGTVGADAGMARLSEPLTGLTPYTRYHVRLVATNSAGRTVGADKTFYTLREPTGVSIAVAQPHPVWGEAVTVTGAVSGEGIQHIEVALERESFPFTAGFARVGPPVSADALGRFAFTLPAVYSATQLRVVTNTRLIAASPVVEVPVALKVGLVVRRLRDRRVGFTGAVWPAVPDGRATLLRHERKGRWIKVARASLAPLRLDRSRYRFNVTAPRKGLYRVAVTPRDGGAHVPGTSRARKVPRRG